MFLLFCFVVCFCCCCCTYCLFTVAPYAKVRGLKLPFQNSVASSSSVVRPCSMAVRVELWNGCTAALWDCILPTTRCAPWVYGSWGTRLLQPYTRRLQNCLNQRAFFITVLEINFWIWSSAGPVGVKSNGPRSKVTGHLYLKFI